LLKQLSVISDADLRSCIVSSEEHLIGLRVVHGYIRDCDPGSSSNNIKDLLVKTLAGAVVEVDLDSDPPEVLNQADVLFLYEDGLWSGVELVRRLQLLVRWQLVKARALRIVFRFAATADLGLYAGRHFVRRERLASVEICSGAVAHTTLARPGSIEALGVGVLAPDDAIREALDSCVVPWAFRSEVDWPDGIDEAMEFCRTVGSQLVRPWIERTKGKTDIELRVPQWSLGAFGFATMTAFPKSVPKPALPLVWLGGPVRYEGKEFNWQPLFWDSRRMGMSQPKMDD
jgi:hypothetical protein